MVTSKKHLSLISRFRVNYRKASRQWWFVFVRIPVYTSVLYLMLVIFLSTAFSRAYLFEFLLTIIPKTRLNGVNVLLMGIDNTKDIQRSDTIMVLHLDADRHRIGVLSIPRDSRVNVPGVGLTKINHAYAYGGPPLLKSTVISFLGIPIDYYIKVNLGGVQELVDDLGGIDVNVSKNMYYVDQAGDLFINLKAGQQHLNGSKTVQFIRFRHDGTSDIGRIQRQQLVAQSLADRMVDLGNKLDIPRVITKLGYEMETDMSGKEIAGFAVQFRDAIREKNVDTGTVPGDVALIGGVSYWKPNISEMDKTISTILMGIDGSKDQVVSKVETSDSDASQDTRRKVTLKEIDRITSQSDSHPKPPSNSKSTPPTPLVVEVLNGSGLPGEANRLAAKLKKMGYKVKRTGNAGSFKYAHSMMVDWKGKVDNSVNLATTLSIDPGKIIVYDRPTKSIDITIVIGRDVVARKPTPSKESR
ncbi:LytR family transcriptional regulator [bacterium]|nr:LytR family transcriptional regulator [bacterium]